MAYSLKQRADKGFDFFNGNQKINVNEYVKAQNLDKNQLVQNLASRGDVVSQQATRRQALPSQFSAFTQPRLSSQAQARIKQTDDLVKQAQADIWNPAKILGDVGKGIADVGNGAVAMGTSIINSGVNRIKDAGDLTGRTVDMLSGAKEQQDNTRREALNQNTRQRNQIIGQLYDDQGNNTNLAPNQRAQFERQLQGLENSSRTPLATMRDVQNTDIAALDTRKHMTNAVETILDVATAGKGATILQGIKSTAAPVTKELLKQLAVNTAKTGLQTGAIGSAYGLNETAKSPDATPQDYLNAGVQGFGVGALAGVGAQIALPVAGQVIKSASRGAQTTAKALNDTRPSVIARNHPEVLGHDAQYSDLAKQFDTTADPLARRQISQAMAENRAARLTTSQRIQAQAIREQQRGFVAGPLAGDFSKAKAAGRVFDGVDGKPRFEVGDQNAKISPLVNLDANFREGKLGDVLDHKGLFEQYPELADVTVRRNDRLYEDGKGVRGMAVVGKNEIEINPSILPREGEPFDQLKSTLLHEIQHFIQSKESFGRGGSADSAVDLVSRQKSDAYVKMNQHAKSKDKVALDGLWDDLFSGKISQADALKASKSLDDSPDVKAWREAANEYQKLEDLSRKSDHGQYAHLAGEAESRAVSSRMNMTDAQRAKTGFYDSLDVPKKDLIIRNGDGIAMSIEKKPTPFEQSLQEAGIAPTPRLKDKVLTSKPAEYLFGDKKAVQDANFNSKNYVKEQIKSQDVARKADNPSFGAKLKNEVNTKLIDSFAPIEGTLKKAIKNGADIKIGDANHITTQLDRAIRADTIAGQYIKDRGLAKVIQDVPDTKAFDQYLIAKHAADLERSGVKTGRNLQSDAQLVRELGPEYEDYAKQIKQYNDELLDKTVEYGLISKETAQALKVKYPNYVPANRIFSEGEITKFKGTGGGKASIGSQSVVQKIKGSEREIESPLASIASKTSDVIAQGERNKAASILASYKDLPDNPFNLREMSQTETVGAKSTVSYLDNGNVRRFETTPEIAAAAKSLNKEQIGIIGKIVRVPTRMLRLGATGINPGFALANISKDLVSAAINSKHPLRASIFNPKVLGKAGAAALNHKSKSYGELVREGAGGTSFDIARDAPKQTIGQIRADKNIATKALYNVTHPGELLRAVEDTIGRSEEFSRALQYYGNKDAAIAKGMKGSDVIRYGANASRNNTVNFARAGEYGAVLNSALPYLNAGIQGARTFNRAVITRPAQTLTKVAILGTLPILTTTAWNLSDPERKAAYDDINDYEKEGNLIIIPEHPVKDPETGKWNVIKIPVSQEIAGLNNIARTSLEAATGNGEVNATDVLGDLIGTTTSFDTKSGRAIANKVVPQVLKPGIEALTNQNLFTGNKVVPDSQKNLPAAEQYGDYTSGTAKVIGSLTGTSPRVIDNGIKSSTGGAGQNAINFTDNILANLGVIDKSSVQGKSIPDSIGGRFFGASAKQTSDAIDGTFDKARNELIKLDGYKSLSQEDKAKALNRLQTDISAVAYNEADAKNPSDKYEPKKLTKNQRALAEGTRTLDKYLIAPSDSTLSSTKLDPKSKSYSFIDAADQIETDQKKAWGKEVASDEYKPLIDTINKSLPEGLPKLPQTNEVAKLYADFEKAKSDNNWSELQVKKESKKLVTSAYKAQLTENEKFISGLSDKEILAAVDSGEISKDEIDNVIGIDNILNKLGMSQNISNKTRYALGYGALASKSGSGSGRKSGGTKKSIADYLSGSAKMNSTTSSTLSDLSKLLAGTTARGSSKPKAFGQKVALNKITVRKTS